MWRVSQTGGQSTGAEDTGIRELRNLRVFVGWAPDSKRPALLAFWPSCSEGGWQEQKAWDEEPQWGSPGAQGWVTVEHGGAHG